MRAEHGIKQLHKLYWCMESSSDLYSTLSDYKIPLTISRHCSDACF